MFQLFLSFNSLRLLMSFMEILDQDEDYRNRLVVKNTTPPMTNPFVIFKELSNAFE